MMAQASVLLTIVNDRWRNPLDIIQGISLVDLFSIPLYITALLFFAFIVKSRYYAHTRKGTILLTAVSVKLLAAVGFAAVYVYVYNGYGDTFFYYEGSVAVQDAWYHSPLMGLKVITQAPKTFVPETIAYTSRIPGFGRGDAEIVATCKIVGTLMIFSFQSFWLSTILVCFVSFSGVWKLFRFFADQYPDLENKAAWAVFFLPSVLFWGSGLLKDTLCYGALGWITWSVYQIFARRQSVVSHVIIIALASALILSLKAYILYAFIPAVAIYLIILFNPNNEGILLKYTLIPFIVVIMFGGVFLGMQGISQSSEKYAFDNIETKVHGFHSDHGNAKTHQDASIYTLGEVDYSTAGYLKKLPAALNVTYFRPYIWEAREPLQLLSAVESLVFLFLFVRVVFRVGPFNFLKLMWSDPVPGLCAVFALLFGFAVGFTAYNFGALVRFKIQALPYFLMMLHTINYNYLKLKQKVELS